MHKYLFGSKMLKLNNARDEDWLTFIDYPAKEANKMGYKSISFYNLIINYFKQGKNIKPHIFNALFAYQLSNGFFEDEADYLFNDFNVLEHKEVWKEWLKAYINSEEAEKMANAHEALDKRFYHILYQYHMILEDTHEISNEAKEGVQSIHDLEMPASYFYVLRELINAL